MQCLVTKSWLQTEYISPDTTVYEWSTAKTPTKMLSYYILFLKFYSLCFTYKSTIHFELSLVSGMSCGLSLTFWHVDV